MVFSNIITLFFNFNIMNLHDVLQKELKEFPLYSQESEKDPKVLVTFELI
jgi:hypothetical protein